MITSVSDPPDGVARVARVFRLDVVGVRATRGLWCVFGLAAVDAKVAIAERTALADAESLVLYTVDTKVSNLGFPTSATTDRCTRKNGHRAEDVYTKSERNPDSRDCGAY